MNQAYSLGLRSVGEDVTIWPLAKIVSPETISIGDSVIIDDFVFLAGGCGTQIGSFVHIAAHSLIAGGGELAMDDVAGTPAKPIKPRPKGRILELEAELRRTLYDASGRYIPRRLRDGSARS